MSNFTFTFHFHALEKEMATHSSILAWRIPGMGEPGGLPSMGSQRVGHNWSDFAAAAVALSNALDLESNGFRKGRGTRDQIANIVWIREKARQSQGNIYFCFIDYAKAFDCMNHNKVWKIFQEMGLPDHLTCLLRNLCAGQEATVRTGHGTTGWFQIRKGDMSRLYIVTLLI